MATLAASEGGSALFQRSYRSSMDRASTQPESFEESRVELDEDVHRLFGPAVSVTPEYIAAYRPSEELGAAEDALGGAWDVPHAPADREDEHATSSRRDPETQQPSLSYQDETLDETFDGSEDGVDDAEEGRRDGAGKRPATRTDAAAAPRTTLQWLYQLGRQLAGAGGEPEGHPQPCSNGFQPRRPRPAPKKKQVSITQSMQFHNTSA